MLDPIARHDFMATVMTAVADDGVSVVLSSHVLAELERVADYLILLSRGRVQVAGEVDDLLASHRVLTGPAAEADRYTERPVVHARRAEAQAHLLVRAGRGRSGPAGLGGAPGRPGRTRPGLPARARRRRAARPGPRPGRPPVGGDEMTALTMPGRPGHDARLRPVPWRRMAWVTWRQHRAALGGVAALPRRVRGVPVADRPSDAPRLRGPPATRPAHSACAINFTGRYGATAIIVSIFLQAVPALIGAFAGAPVLARELETGTFRYAWTQGFGRWRWTLAKLVLLAVAVTAAAGAFSVLYSWFNQPFVAAGYMIPFSARVFDLRGVAFAAWTLAAFAIGALAGMLIRRVVPAIAATLAVYAGLAFATALWLRQHYMTPLVTQQPEPARFRVDRQPVVHQGRQVRVQRPQRPASPRRPAALPTTRLGRLQTVSPAAVPHPARLHGWASYQPGSRFWPFQWIEGGWLLALSVLLIAATVWLVRRRAA